MASRKLTDYERKRLENIKRNDEMLAAFKIQAKASELSAASKRRKVETKSYKVSPQKNLKTQTPVVIRRSLRARGMPPDSKGLTDDFFDSKNRTPKIKSPEESSLLDMSSENRTPKSLSPEESSLPDMSGPLSFKDAYARPEYDSNRPFIDAILRVTKGPHFGLVEEEFDSVLNVKLKPKVDLPSEEECIESLGGTCDLGCAVKEESDGSKVCENEDSSGKHKVVSSDFIKGVIKTEKSEPRSSVDLGSLTLKEENIARVMKNRIMMVKFFPCTDIRMVVAGGKSGEVAFWNMDSEQEEDGIYLYHTHTGPISGIITQESCLSKTFTSCYDGFIRLMDVETEVFDLVHSSEYAIYSLSQQANNVNNLCFSEGQGILNSWDVRTGKFSGEWLLHEARINTIDFNSQNPNIMATSSSDGTACLWDLRSMDTDKPKPLKIASHGKAVHSAYFSPSGSCLATASFDDTVGIWSGAKFEKTSMIDHNNQTGRWISSFRAIWGWDDSYIFIGNMKRGVDVISPVQRRIIMTLQSPHITAIPCRFHAHPYEVGMLAGATSGGQVYLWTSS